jgi:membrane-associated PAP2 superfamily phosphatase
MAVQVQTATRRFYLWHLGLPLVAAVLVFFVSEHTALDRWVSDRFYDPAIRHFPLRYDWFMETVLHHWAKYVLVLVAFSGLAGFLLSYAVEGLKRWRREMLFVFLAILLGAVTIGILKKTTNKHCPYDMEIYGGFAPYVGLLEATPADVQPGRCWPGGHASGGFGLMAFYLLWYRTRPRLARAALAVGFAYGFVLGFGRVVQGAHFFSHNLWTAIICWCIYLILYELMLRRRETAFAPG